MVFKKGEKRTKTGSKVKTHEGKPRLQNKTGNDQINLKTTDNFQQTEKIKIY